MKRTSFFVPLIVVLIIVGTTAIARANDDGDTATSSRAPFFAPIRRAEEARDNIQERREGFKTRFDEFRKEKIARMLGFMKARFLAAIERLRDIADRIDARIEKVEDETGKDLSEASGYVNDARESLDEAEDLLEAVGTSTDALFSDENTAGERFGRLRELFIEAKAKIKEARGFLGQALRAIGWSRGNDGATTTTSN